MSRQKRQQEISTDHDSFLDIVANIVGILIILVVLVGVRAKHAPVIASIVGPLQRIQQDEINDDLAVEKRISADILEIKKQGLRLAEEAILRDRQRNELAMLVSAAQHGLDDDRKRLDNEARKQFDLKRRLAESQTKLKALMRDSLLVQQEKNEAKPISLEHHPTPISHTVHGREIHLLLRTGRVVVVPFDKLVEQFKDEFQRKAYRLQHQRQLTDKMGPVDGFRLRYTLERFDVTPELYEQSGRGGSVVRLRRVEFLPISSRLGETLDEALADGSLLRQTLARHRPDRDTVTVWTYPDGFGDYQRLKKLFYRLGYSMAARPLPFGVPITASPEGSRSAAQ